MCQLPFQMDQLQQACSLYERPDPSQEQSDLQLEAASEAALDSTVLGIDGGDGSYNVINEHESVASVTFTDDVNGYQSIKIHPLAEGETIVKVMDGSGEETQLRITVKGRRQYTLTKIGFEYGISSGAPTELLGDVSIYWKPFLSSRLT